MTDNLGRLQRFKRSGDIRDRAYWHAQREWRKAKLEGLHRVLRPRVQQLSISTNGAAAAGDGEPREDPWSA